MPQINISIPDGPNCNDCILLVEIAYYQKYCRRFDVILNRGQKHEFSYESSKDSRGETETHTNTWYDILKCNQCLTGEIKNERA